MNTNQRKEVNVDLKTSLFMDDMFAFSCSLFHGSPRLPGSSSISLLASLYLCNLPGAAQLCIWMIERQDPSDIAKTRIWISVHHIFILGQIFYEEGTTPHRTIILLTTNVMGQTE